MNRTARALLFALAVALLGPVLAFVSTAAAGPPEPVVRLFDMGSDDSPLWAGFTRVTPATTYDPARGFGWLNPPGDLRVNVSEHIDGLAADSIWGRLNKRIGFRVDVPAGSYRVFVLTGAMGNIWNLRYLRASHQLLLQGKVVAKIEPREEEVFRVANYDWRKGDDPFDHFVAPRFTWLAHDVTLTAKSLEFGFDSGHDFPVCAIVVVPADHAVRAEQAIRRIDSERRAAFHQFWSQQTQPPGPAASVSAEERRRGYIVAAIDCDDDLHPWSQPAAEASRSQIDIYAAPGQQEQASLAVFGLRDLEQVCCQVSDLRSFTGHTIPAAAIECSLVQFLPWPERGRRRHAQYTLRECLILPGRPTFVGADTCKRFWLTAQVPPSASPDTYEGRVTISASGAPSASLAFRLHVLPITLAVSPVEHFMYFGSMYDLAYALLPNFDEKRYWDSLRAEVRFMRDNEFCRAECLLGNRRTRFSGAFKMEGGRVIDVDLSDTDKLIRILREEKAWPRDNAMICRTEPMLYLGGGKLSVNTRQLIFCPTDEGRTNFIRAVQIVDRKARQAGWPEVVFDCFGEYSNFGDVGANFGLAVHTALKEAGVLNTLRGNGPSDMVSVHRGLVAIPQPNWAMMRTEWLDFMRKRSRRLWAYNYAESRFAFGWFTFKHGFVRGSYESGVYANGQPGNAFEIDTMFPMGLPLSMTKIVPALWLKRLVQGSHDHQYLYNLAALVRQAASSGSEPARRAARQAQAYLDQKLATIPNGLDRPHADPRDFGDVQGDQWPKHVLGRYRWEVAQHICEIQKALARAQP